MDSMQFKVFVWPRNPEIYRETITREPLYRTVDGVAQYEAMSSMRRVITGEGSFSGKKAYAHFLELVALAEEEEAGELIHPVWGMRYCYLTKLELIQEPRVDFVRYRFEFTQAQPNGTVPR